MPETKPTKKDAGEFIADVLDRFRRAVEAQTDERRLADEDLRFLDGEDQWDSLVRNVREESMRPCLTINKLPAFLDSIVGEQRQNRPSIKVIGVDGASDPEVAGIYTGLIRNIETQSDAELAYDTAFESAAACGRGLFKIVTEYVDDNSFDQTIKIKRKPNPFVFYYDPAAIELDLSDADFEFLTETMDLEEFERRFPNHEAIDWDNLSSDEKEWFQKDAVRVAEYWARTWETVTLYQSPDGTVTEDEPEDPGVPVKKRTQERAVINSYFLSGKEILDGPNRWPGTSFPNIPVWGKELWVDGRCKRRGAIRHAKDSQRMYNYFRSVSVETAALSPKDPWILSGEQIGVYAEQWQDAHIKTYPYLLYSHQDGQPPPYRAGPPQLSTAIAAEVQTAAQDMRDTTGIHEASQGMPSNEKSGKAIRERRMSGDRSAYPYMDNLIRALRHAGRVIVDLIPKIYDHDRIVRIIGDDGTESFVPVNVSPGDPNQLLTQMGGKSYPGRPEEPWAPIDQVLNDLTTGRYDVVVTTGPSYLTQREEAAESMLAFSQAIPTAAPLIADLVARSMDWPEAQRIAARLKKTVPPEVLGQDEIDDEEELPPPEDPMNDPKVALEMVKLQLKREELEVKAFEAATQGMLNIAKAEGVEAGQQFQIYQAMLEQIRMKYASRKEAAQMQTQGPPPSGPTGPAGPKPGIY